MSQSAGHLKDPLKKDFRNFLFAIWKHLGLPDPTPIQYDIALYLQHGPRRGVIEAFRGVGKSWITAAFVLWLLYRDPNTRVFVVSANADRAAAFTTFVLRLIHEVPFLQHLKPRHSQRQSTLAFDVGPASPDQAPSVRSLGITGQMTGGRADIIVADDIEIPHNSDTPTKREKLLDLVKEFDAVLKPNGRVMYLGTPQSEQTIYEVLKERGYDIRIWPARYPRDPGKYANKLAPIIVKRMQEGVKAGEPCDPDRFHNEDLLERELSYGKSGFALQFMLDTQLSDAERHPLKLSDLIVHPLDPLQAPVNFVWAADGRYARDDLPMVGLHGDRYYGPAWTSEDHAEYEGAIMFVDPAGRGRDECAYAVVKHLYGRLFLTAAGGYRGTGYDDTTLESLLKVAKAQRVQKIIVEPNFGGGMFAQMLLSKSMREYGIAVEDAEWQRTQKEMRIIDTLEPVLNQHRLVVCPSVITRDYETTQNTDYGDKAVIYRLFYQLTRIAREKDSLAQDDRLDALAGAVAYWLDTMARNSEDGALVHKERLLDEELKKFVEHALGGKNPKTVALRSSTGRGAMIR